MIKKLSLIVLLTSISFSSAQELKFGKVTKEELSEKVCPIDSSANAMVLYKYRNTYFIVNAAGGQMVTEVQERIKVYNKEGFEYATKDINLFKSGSSRENVGRIRANTYNLENGKIVETELEKDQIFKNEQSYNFNQVKFTMPNVKEGSVVEFKYKITSPFFTNVDEFRFQSGIPIKKIEARLKTPESYVFKPTYKGYISFFPTRESYTDNRLGETMIIESYNLNDIPACIDALKLVRGVTSKTCPCSPATRRQSGPV